VQSAVDDRTSCSRPKERSRHASGPSSAPVAARLSMASRQLAMARPPKPSEPTRQGRRPFSKTPPISQLLPLVMMATDRIFNSGCLTNAPNRRGSLADSMRQIRARGDGNVRGAAFGVRGAKSGRGDFGFSFLFWIRKFNRKSAIQNRQSRIAHFDAGLQHQTHCRPSPNPTNFSTPDGFAFVWIILQKSSFRLHLAAGSRRIRDTMKALDEASALSTRAPHAFASSPTISTNHGSFLTDSKSGSLRAQSLSSSLKCTDSSRHLRH
jgi:hypothetical protein